MRRALLPLLLLTLPWVSCGPPPVGDIVRCERFWICDGSVIAEQAGPDAKTFCTDPANDIRNEQIATYQAEFAETCDDTPPETCNSAGQDFDVVCEATCTTGGGECPLADVVAVKL